MQEEWPDVVTQLSAGVPLSDALLAFITEELVKLHGASATALSANAPAQKPTDRLVVSFDNTVWHIDWKIDEKSKKKLKADPSHEIQSTPLNNAPVPVVNAGDGAVRIIGVDILRFAQAQAGLDLYRNRSFQLYGKQVPAAEPFIYHFGGIRAGRPVTPRLTHDTVFESLRVQSLEAHVSEILQALFPSNIADISPTYDLDLALVTAVLSIGRPSAGPILPPLFSPPGTPLPRIVGLNRNSKDNDTIVRAIRIWWHDQAISAPATSNPAEYRRLRFAFTVYRDGEGAAGATPILRILRVEVPLRSIMEVGMPIYLQRTSRGAQRR